MQPIKVQNAHTQLDVSSTCAEGSRFFNVMLERSLFEDVTLAGTKIMKVEIDAISGKVLEVEEERLEELKSAPGAELVNFERGRVKPRTIFNFSAGVNLFKREKVVCAAQIDILNIADKFFAYNFGNPFEGTHFGYGRRWSGGLRIEFR